MNPLAELHERLAYSAAAGTALLEEDFRLKKIMEGFAPLAQKNPVFAKIHQGLADLFGAAPEERGKRLLNLLGLVDAVLYTQAGYGTEGELAACSEIMDLKVQNIRYSELSVLIQALTASGSRRIDVLTDTMAYHPEYFRDYRIMHALIDDLADPYGEIGTLVFRILRALATGEPVTVCTFWEGVYQERHYRLPQIERRQLVSQLKYGFDPAGKTNMTRRMMLICTIAGAEENDWYLSLLHTAKKEIRAFTVFALGYTEENIPLLLKLAQKERGKAKEMAYRALCQWDTPEVVTLMEKLLDNDPKLAVYLSSTARDVYGDMAAKHLQTELSKRLHAPDIPYGQKDVMNPWMDIIAPWVEALENKASKGVLALCEWVGVHHAEIKNVQRYAMLSDFYDKLCDTLMLRCPSALVDFLQHDPNFMYQEPCFLADIFTLSAADFYDKWREHCPLNWLQRIDNTPEKKGATSAGRTLYVRGTETEPLLSPGAEAQYIRQMKEPLDLRWIDVFIQKDWEEMFVRMPRDLPEVWREKAGAYFYNKALQEPKRKYGNPLSMLYERLEKMQQYGWKTYDNILVSLVKAYPLGSEYEICKVFAAYRKAAGRENGVREAQRVLDYYRENSKLSDGMLYEVLKDNGYLTVKGFFLSPAAKALLKKQLKEPLDLRWIDVFIQMDWEDMFERVPRDLPEVWRKKAGAYFYNKALQEPRRRYQDPLSMLYGRLEKMQQYGWETYDNILVSLCKVYPPKNESEICEIFTAYQKAAGRENTAREALRVVDYYRENSKLSDTAIRAILKDNGFLKGSEGIGGRTV